MTDTSPTRNHLAWGRRVSTEFRTKLFAIAQQLGADPDHLMAGMAFETGESFRPDIRNAAGSGATGLIQFMPATARGLGTTTQDLAAMTAERQLDYVSAYFRPYRGRLRNLGDVYMAILLPKYIGQPDDAVLFSGGVAYRQNAGLDSNSDGKITRAEACAKVRAKLDKGLLPAYCWRAQS